ncbi:hypothetical protein HYC85_018185 [Camellia sinensis]|uniref:Copine C-terminal domain-containing protein n=1 Tax=Camellia sinensis TaxID=4442 RepID=A0A7J7GXH9_CAMSI|nr:hypothetical protein HYC85_018185 [Camellia sinensis]
MGGNPTKLDSYHGGSASGYGSHSYAESYVNSERRRAHSRYTRIGDDYSSLDQVTEALTQAGLESSNLIVGIDFTKSNEWTGARSFDRKSLHHLGDSPNPYEQAISIIGRTIAAFDEDNLIPCYGFGDATTHDQEVFSFYPDDKPCNGFEEALSRYRELVPQICLSGPTSFAPMIETATTIVDASGGQYHVLLIIADGQVHKSAGTKIGKLSSQEQNTINAIAKASEFPLSIVLVGVVCELYRDYVKKHPNIQERGSICSGGINGNTITVQSNNRSSSFGMPGKEFLEELGSLLQSGTTNQPRILKFVIQLLLLLQKVTHKIRFVLHVYGITKILPLDVDIRCAMIVGRTSTYARFVRPSITTRIRLY